MDAHQRERGEKQCEAALPEPGEADHHNRDLEQFDVADDPRLLELVGDLAARRGEQHERRDEYRTGKIHERIGIECGEARRLERDEDDERVLVDVVVRRTEELRPKERRETALAQQIELVRPVHGEEGDR